MVAGGALWGALCVVLSVVLSVVAFGAQHASCGIWQMEVMGQGHF